MSVKNQTIEINFQFSLSGMLVFRMFKVADEQIELWMCLGSVFVAHFGNLNAELNDIVTCNITEHNRLMNVVATRKIHIAIIGLPFQLQFYFPLSISP